MISFNSVTTLGIANIILQIDGLGKFRECMRVARLYLVLEICLNPITTDHLDILVFSHFLSKLTDILETL